MGLSFNVLENFSLKNYNTFGVEVAARYFAEVQTLADLQAVLQFAKEENLPLLFLGGGSNLLFTGDFAGVVVKVDFKGITELPFDDDHVLVTAQAGENWHDFVQFTLQKNYGGLENLSLIPGNVGTSPMQNIGAYGVEIKDTFMHCTVYDLEENVLKIFDNASCEFGYRESVFKKVGKGRYILLEVTFKLTTKNHQLKTEYGAIKTELEKMKIFTPSIQDVSKAVIAIRQSKLPDPKVIGNAGSFFKNPSISLVQFETLKQENPEIPGYQNGDLVKIPAAWLIEQCGWKGVQIGNVACHQLQPLVIVNFTGKATGKEIYDFSTKIISSVNEKFQIPLEREVNVI